MSDSEEAKMETNREDAAKLAGAVENAVSWVLGSAEDLYDTLLRLTKHQGSAKEEEAMRAYFRPLVSQLDRLHEQIHQMVLAAEAWEGRLAGGSDGDAVPRRGDEQLSPRETGGDR